MIDEVEVCDVYLLEWQFLEDMNVGSMLLGNSIEYC